MALKLKIFSGLLLLSIILGISLTYTGEESPLEQLARQTLQDKASGIQDLLLIKANVALDSQQYLDFEQSAKIFNHSSLVDGIYLVDQNGKVVSTIHNHGAMIPMAHEVNIHQDIIRDNQTIGKLVLSFSPNVVNEAFASARSSLLLIVTGSLVFLMLLANSLGNFIPATALTRFFTKKASELKAAIEDIDRDIDQGASASDQNSAKKSAKVNLALEDFVSSRKKLDFENANYEIVRNALDAIVMVNKSGLITEFNPTAEKLFEYSRSEVLGKALHETILLEQDVIQYEKLLMCLNALESPHLNQLFECEFKTRKNRKIPTSVYVTNIGYGDNRQYAVYLRDISSLKQTEDRLKYLSYNDELTGLPNQYVMTEHLRSATKLAEQNQRRVAVVKLGLDRFKHINESLGHDAGDELMKSVAQRLKKSIRRGDLVSRTSGDQFVLSLVDVAKDTDLDLLLQKYLDCFEMPFSIAGQDLHVSVSLGVTIFPHDEHTVEGLLRNAESAMFRAKEKTGSNYQFFSAEMRERSRERLYLENELRNAIANNQLELHYQPQVNLETGKIMGTEALIRWNHPKMGMVPPGKFIALAEETGLIVSIGEWVLREGCMHNKALMQKQGKPLVLAVNLSARQFGNKNLVDTIASVLHETQHPAELLELEITESLLMENLEDATEVLHILSNQGIRIALDDFGTGYSSLSYLKRFPISTLKVDRSFVQDIESDTENASIVKATIQMAHSLNIDIVAEGVENEHQLQFLINHNCDKMQGFYFSRPLASDALSALLSGDQRIKMEDNRIRLISGF